MACHFSCRRLRSSILPPAIWSVPMVPTRWCGDISTPDHQIRKYVAIQQWFTEKHPVIYLLHL